MGNKTKAELLDDNRAMRARIAELEANIGVEMHAESYEARIAGIAPCEDEGRQLVSCCLLERHYEYLQRAAQVTQAQRKGIRWGVPQELERMVRVQMQLDPDKAMMYGNHGGTLPATGINPVTGEMM